MKAHRLHFSPYSYKVFAGRLQEQTRRAMKVPAERTRNRLGSPVFGAVCPSAVAPSPSAAQRRRVTRLRSSSASSCPATARTSSLGCSSARSATFLIDRAVEPGPNTSATCLTLRTSASRSATGRMMPPATNLRPDAAHPQPGREGEASHAEAGKHLHAHLARGFVASNRGRSLRA
jgi:hypothetical protein